MDQDGNADFEDVLCWLGWWDCPRHGVCLIRGVPHMFDNSFDEELDDYPDEFWVWPASAAEIADEQACFERFVEWRQKLDSRNPPYERAPRMGAPGQRIRDRGVPSAARLARPEWILDQNNYSHGPPHHRVRWQFSPVDQP